MFYFIYIDTCTYLLTIFKVLNRLQIFLKVSKSIFTIIPNKAFLFSRHAFRLHKALLIFSSFNRFIF